MRRRSSGRIVFSFLLRYGSPLLENLLYPSSAASSIFRPASKKSQNMAATLWQRSRGSNPPCLRSPDHVPLGCLVLHWTAALMALSLKIQASSISTARQGKLVVISLFSAQSTSARSVGRPPKKSLTLIKTAKDSTVDITSDGFRPSRISTAFSLE